MGVKQLYVIRSNGTTRKTIHDGISAVLELLTVSHKEKWAVRCNFYRSSLVNDDGAARAAGQRDVCLVRFPQVVTPHVFLVQCKERHVMECQDTAVSLLVDRMVAYQPQRVGFHIEGIAYRVGDFVVRLGSIVTKPGDENKGWMLEVEYLPVDHWADCAKLIQAFVDMLRDGIGTADVTLRKVVTAFDEYSLPPKYGVHHSALQYALLCSSL